jgi:hypothetical protein
VKPTSRFHRVASALAVGTLVLVTSPVRATIPVIDVAALTQLLMQLNAWTEQLRGMEQQLGQLRETYGAMTGLRGMDRLLRLSDAARNYLPPDWAALEASLAGATGAYPAIAAAVRTQSAANAILSPAELARYPAGLRKLLTADRQAVAGGQTLTRLAYSRSSDRFAALSTFIDTIGATPDAKSIAELQGRIQAEQTMLANEGLKLASLAQVAAAETSARELARREQIVANHGTFATRFQPTPPAP